jgi:hypothetical protein
MTWISVVAIIVFLTVMARASNLIREGSMLPDSMHGALQIVGVFAIMVATLGIIVLSSS